jgi:hypothetical protein
VDGPRFIIVLDRGVKIMPYQLQKNCVMKKNPDGSLTTVKCHPTRAKALAHLSALYIHVPDAADGKGGSGSGNFGHSGRPGLIGGSAGDGGGGGAKPAGSAGPTKKPVVAAMNAPESERTKVVRMRVTEALKNDYPDAEIRLTENVPQFWPQETTYTYEVIGKDGSVQETGFSKYKDGKWVVERNPQFVHSSVAHRAARWGV